MILMLLEVTEYEARQSKVVSTDFLTACVFRGKELLRWSDVLVSSFRVL